MTSPYYDSGEQLDGQPWDEDDPGPGRHPQPDDRVGGRPASRTGVVVPLNKYLDPDGHFTASIDGQVMRFADGVHTTEAAGTYLAPKILPQLAAAGRSP